MAFSSGVFSRLYNWTTDKVNGVKIRADRMDAEFDGIATALSTCILKDGTQTLTAAIPWNSQNLTGVNNLTVTGSTASTNTTSGAIVVTGGLGVGGAVHAGASSSVTLSQNSTTSLTVTNSNVGGSAVVQLAGTTDAGTVQIQGSSTAGGAHGVLRWTGSGTFFIDALNAAGDFSFRTGAGPTEAMSISAAGLVSLPIGQLKFPAAQNASADANTLDDYEEGTWTPAGTSGVTLTVTSASYTKIGNRVFISFDVTWPVTANSDNAQITGLPFTSGAASGFGMGYTATHAGAYVGAASTTIDINNPATGSSLSHANMSAKRIIVGGSYRV